MDHNLYIVLCSTFSANERSWTQVLPISTCRPTHSFIVFIQLNCTNNLFLFTSFLATDHFLFCFSLIFRNSKHHWTLWTYSLIYWAPHRWRKFLGAKLLGQKNASNIILIKIAKLASKQCHYLNVHALPMYNSKAVFHIPHRFYYNTFSLSIW